ncbi:MAG: protease modulator HflC [Chromatiales bacterium]|nr:protease modulator HflC [Chromatiales bacterium]MDH3893168.1 protease modulator HflC [Chromatiales bacterium]MDH3931964.1 protease modulator HflC [Chromatiales bacterium]MDH4012671.1 protease modulator HflC [Chromatiales bacterium]
MSNKFSAVLVVLALAALAVSMSVFIVDEREMAIKFRFGEIMRSDYEPGLHFKVPIVNNIRTFPDLILTLDNRPERFLTGERKFVLVDFFVKWRISDIDSFYRATRGDELVASNRLLSIVRDGLRDTFAERTIQEVVSAERSALLTDMLTSARAASSDLGVTIVDVRVKRIDLPDEVSGSVFERMRQERARVASQLRAEGAEQSEKLRAEADRQRTVMLAEAYREAEQIRGEGDARAAEIYAEAFSQNTEFYYFHRSLEAYRRSVGRDGDILVLKPDSDFFRYFRYRNGAESQAEAVAE